MGFLKAEVFESIVKSCPMLRVINADIVDVDVKTIHALNELPQLEIVNIQAKDKGSCNSKPILCASFKRGEYINVQEVNQSMQAVSEFIKKIEDGIQCQSRISIPLRVSPYTKNLTHFLHQCISKWQNMFSNN